MKLIKSVNSLLLCFTIVLSLSACNNKAAEKQSSSSVAASQVQASKSISSQSTSSTTSAAISSSQISKATANQASNSVDEIKDNKAAKSKFSFTNQSKDIQELYDKAEIVVIGTVISSRPAPVGKAAFTNFELNELKVLKNTIKFDESNIVPSMTGGEVNGKTYQSKEIKLVNVGDTYMFFLKRTYPDKNDSNLFTPLGAYQGIIKLESKNTADSLTDSKANSSSNDLNAILNNYNVVPFNDQNAIEKSVEGKALSEIAEIK